MPIRVLLVENQPLIRLGIHSALSGESDIDIIGDAVSAADGFDAFVRLRPDVVLLGLRLPDSCSIDDLTKYFAVDRAARIIVLAEHAGDSEISRALKGGALGYICKDVDPRELTAAVRAVARGRRYLPSEIAAIIGENLGREELTPAESDVLRMLVGGMSNKEIAFALEVSENTIKSHVRSIFEKLGVSDRTTAATTAIKRGLVRVDL